MPKRTAVIVTDYRPKILAGSTTASGGAQTLIVHDINTSHSSNLLWSRLDKAGSSLADIVTRPHGALTDIGTNTHAQIDSHIGTADIHVAHSGVTLTAGNGLTGGGTIAASRTLAVGAGDGITVNADDVAVDSTVVRTSREINSGGGLTGGGNLSANRTLAVGAGTLITVGADTVGITPGANFQFIGTGNGTAAGWRNVSELAGNGLDSASGVLAVGVANTGATGLSVESNAVRLTSNSNPGATAAILASDANGGLGLLRLTSNSAFTSGFAGGGYRIDEGVSEIGKTSAEFDNLTVRGRMRVYELLIQQIRATNGSVFVSSSSRAEVVTEDNDWYVNGEQLDLNGVGASFDIRLFTIRTRTTTGSGDRNLYHGFLVNDILRAQRVDIGTGGSLITRQVNLLVTKFVDLWEYDALLVSGDGDVPVVGDEMVRLGSTTDTTRQGSIYLTSDDSNAPFIDIVNEVSSHAEWNQAGKIKARLGRLSGITDSAFGGNLSGYGLYSDNVYLKGQIVVTGGNAATTDALSSGLATKIGTGGAAADVNANTTTISGGKITTGSITAGQIAAGTITGDRIAAGTITAAQINVSQLSALSVDLGSVTAGQIVVEGVSNKLWLNDTNDGGLAIGGTTKGSAPFRVTAAGALTSTSGAIGGWTLGANTLISGSGTDTVGLQSNQGTFGVAIYAGSATPLDAPFRVLSNGSMTAISGSIGGWSLSQFSLISGGGTSTIGLRSNQLPSGVAIYAGSATATSAPFRVTAGGALTATSGAIANWTINTDELKSGSGFDTVGLRSNQLPSGVAIYAGNATPANAPFRVTAGGALTATSGAIANWTINTNELKSGSGFDTVGLRSGQITTEVAIYAGNATPANAPFRVTAAGALTATSGAIGGWTIGPTAINSSTLTIDASGPSIRSGKTSYSSTATGFWIGLDSSTPKFNFGSSTQYIRWNGTALEINRPTLSAEWTNATYNPDAEWDTYEDTNNNVYGHPLKYVRMGDFVFVTGWVENTVGDTQTDPEHATVTKTLPKPDGTQFIYARSNVDNSNTAGGYGNTFKVEASGNNGHLILLVNPGGGNVVVQNLIINGWYKAAA